MAERIFLRKTYCLSSAWLQPADRYSAEVLERMPAGEVVRADVRRPRRLRHHRWYFALLGMIHPQQDLYATVEDLHAAIKVSVGCGHTVKLPDGRTILVPGSIAFDKMDETAFSDFTEKVVALVCSRIIPNMQADELRAEVEALIAGGRAA